MQSAMKLTTTVLPGRRIEFSTPELIAGEEVELIVMRSEQESVTASTEKRMGVWDYIQSLPTSNLTPEDWEHMEREFREERDSWGD